MEKVTLNNNSKVEGSVFISAAINLNDLFDSNPIALYELREKCRNPDHKMFGNAEQIISNLDLMDNKGQIHKDIRAIVLSEVKGEGSDIRLSGQLRDYRIPTASQSRSLS